MTAGAKCQGGSSIQDVPLKSRWAREQVEERENVCDCQKCDTHQGSSAPRNTSDSLGFCDPVKTEIASQTQRGAMITISLRSLLLL